MLHWAATNGRTAVAALLLDAGAAIDSVNRHGETALHLAANGGQTCEQVVSLLITRSADVHMQDAGGDTPLMKAAKKGSKGGMAKLIGAGADKNYVNTLAPLQWAVLNDNQPVYELLKQKGAKPHPQCAGTRRRNRARTAHPHARLLPLTCVPPRHSVCCSQQRDRRLRDPARRAHAVAGIGMMPSCVNEFALWGTAYNSTSG